MDVSKPYTAVSPTLDGDVLMLLAGTTRPLTGREVARLVRRSERGVRLVLARLVEHGLVDRQEAGPSMLYTLNRDHLAAPAVETLADMRTELQRRLRDAFDSWKPAPVHASLFGSTARRDGDTSSDIDIFVVRPSSVDDDDPRWREQMNLLSDRVQAWTGNHAGIIEMPREDLDDLVASQPPVLSELREDAVHLVGTPLARLLRATREHA
jgi:DNA-binding transcriptional ArsR family regulator